MPSESLHKQPKNGGHESTQLARIEAQLTSQSQLSLEPTAHHIEDQCLTRLSLLFPSISLPLSLSSLCLYFFLSLTIELPLFI
jgi:hypothetical protein